MADDDDDDDDDNDDDVDDAYSWRTLRMQMFACDTTRREKR